MGQNGHSSPQQWSEQSTHTYIWGPSLQLDDQYRNPNINNRDHLVGQLTINHPAVAVYNLRQLKSVDVVGGAGAGASGSFSTALELTPALALNLFYCHTVGCKIKDFAVYYVLRFYRPYR